ncbi:diguanylate cyclase [Pacificimonas sp. ICDLI1SI03]
MTARILIVDDMPTNIMLLQAILEEEFYDVVTAGSGEEALELAAREQFDLVLLDIMMPDQNGYCVCRRLKALSETRLLPVILVTAISDPEARAEGLAAGADDFITKPINAAELIARVRSVLRQKFMFDELSGPEDVSGSVVPFAAQLSGERDRTVALIDNGSALLTALKAQLVTFGEVRTLPMDDALDTICKMHIDLVALPISAQERGGLELLARLRGNPATRDIPILAAATEDRVAPIVRAFDLGAGDCVRLPASHREIEARVRTLLRRRMFAERLRGNVHLSLRLATTDAVTGLFNRHYLTSQLETMCMTAAADGTPLSLILLDLDRFKRVNDDYGHTAGDIVLRRIADMIAANVRGVDVAARFGGEEFAIILPSIGPEEAWQAAERIRRLIEKAEIDANGQCVRMTTSAGVATLTPGGDLNSLIARADRALYAAKYAGRNRTETDRDGDGDAGWSGDMGAGFHLANER